MKMKTKLEKIIVLLLILSMLAGTVGTSSIQAKEETKKSYRGDGCEVTYVVREEWGDGYNATVQIRNTGRKKIENWNITFQHPPKITNIWNAAIESRENDFYTLKNAGWNQDIPAGDTVSFGITVSGKAEQLPEEYYLNGIIKEVEKSNYTVDIHRTDCWTNGDTNEQEYTGIVEITNVSEKAIEEWELCFSMKDTICEIWNGEIISRENATYRIKGCEYNQNIEPKQSVSFGFLCRVEENDEPKSFTLSEFVSGEKEKTEEGGSESTGTPTPTSTSSMTSAPSASPSAVPDEEEIEENELNEKTVYDYVNIDLKMGNAYNSVLDDVRFLNAAPEELQVAWKSSNPEIISQIGDVTRPEKDTSVQIIAEILFEGKEYSKNFELIVMAKNSIQKEDIEDLSVSDLDRMNQDDEDYEVEINDYGYLESVMGQYSEVKVNSYEAALYSLYSIQSAMGITDPFSELKPYDTKANENGYIFKFNQTYKGIPVYGSQVVVSSDTEGCTDSFLSDYFPVDENVELEPELSFEEAVEKIKASYADIDMISDTPQFYILNYNGQCDLVWEICFYSNSEQDGLKQGEYKALIDAQDGEVKYLGNESCNFSSRVYTTGTDLLEKQKGFWIKKKTSLFYDTKYCLEDTKRNISIFDEKGESIGKGEKIEKKKKDNWTQTEVSAIVNMNDTYDYYRTKHNRFSYDNALFQMSGNDIYVHIYTELKNNAYWHFDTECIELGTGDGEKYLARSWGVGLDVLAHEFTHAVTMHETSLDSVYRGVTGAINEAYSDIMAAYVDGNWQSGEDVTIRRDHPLRDMAEPLKRGDPDYFGGANFVNYRVVPLDEDHDYGGVHTNSTILSHIAYLMQEEEFKNKQVDKLWYESLCLGYRKKTDFYDVKKKVVKAAKRLKYSEDDVEKIKKIFTNAGITKRNCNESDDYFKKADKAAGFSAAYFNNEISVNGKVAEVDNDTNNANNRVLEDVDITLMEQLQSKVLEETITDEDGEYELPLSGDEDVYCAKFSLDGFLDETMYIDSVNDPLQDGYRCDMIELIPVGKDGYGTASGVVRDAVTGEGVEQANLLIRKGINNHYTEVVDTILTGSDGVYQTNELQAGNYCVEIQENDGGSSHFNIKILRGECVENQNGILSPPVTADQMRVVLSWKKSPVDLDLHMMCKLSNGRKRHVYFGSKKFYMDNEIAFALDCDAQTGYGPETITLYMPKTGDYVFYVNNYEEEAEMGGCGAMVQVYFGNQTTPARTFHVPKTSGLNWEVFHYNSATNRIRVSNRMLDKEPKIADYWR